MKKEEVRARIEEIGIVPAVRFRSAEDARFATEAVSHGGIPIVEITMTVPGAIELIGDLARNSPDVIVGAGTLFDTETARKCLDAGARFLTSPGLDLAIVELGMKKNVVVLAGALTPTEVTMAWKAGADFAQDFPVFASGRGQIYQSAERAVPACAVDRGGRGESDDSGELHSCGSGGDRGRRRAGTGGGHQAATGRTNS